jgi:hypothetical protein
VPIVLKSGIFKLLENSRPVQACNGIALPLEVTVTHFTVWVATWSFLPKAENIEKSITLRIQ